MLRSISLILLTAALCGCSQSFRYHFVEPEAAKRIHADSLKWKYAAGKVVALPVMDKQADIYWLDVTPGTKLFVRTIDGEEYYFLLSSIEVDEAEDGLLGSNAKWRGYDTRQGVERSVLIREVASSEILSPVPAGKRILPQ